jgi:phage-related minor tail protein
MGRLRLRLLVARRDFRDLSSDVLDELKNNNILKASGTIKDEIDSFSNKIIDANDIALGVYSKLGQSLRDTRTVLGLRKQLL